MAMKSELVEELRIAPEDFDRVRHIWRGFEKDAASAPVGAVAHCGARKLEHRPGVTAATCPDLCVVCGVLRGHRSV